MDYFSPLDKHITHVVTYKYGSPVGTNSLALSALWTCVDSTTGISPAMSSVQNSLLGYTKTC